MDVRKGVDVQKGVDIRKGVDVRKGVGFQNGIPKVMKAMRREIREQPTGRCIHF